MASAWQSASAWAAGVVNACAGWCRGAPSVDLPKQRVYVQRQLADGATGIVYLVEDSQKRPYALYVIAR